jgi:hypothetical protein
MGQRRMMFGKPEIGVRAESAICREKWGPE